jgi:hypothetical protein
MQASVSLPFLAFYYKIVIVVHSLLSCLFYLLILLLQNSCLPIDRTEVRLRHWKQHVAILLANRSDRLKYFLMTLGDRLYNESINASHFW